LVEHREVYNPYWFVGSFNTVGIVTIYVQPASQGEAKDKKALSSPRSERAGQVKLVNQTRGLSSSSNNQLPGFKSRMNIGQTS
jgi:hypothetical protein